MPTRAENINTRLDAIATELAAMSPTEAGGLPDAPNNVGHVAYRLSLIQEMKMLREELIGLQRIGDDGAYEVTSEMWP
jgi:hypothetical protein